MKLQDILTTGQLDKEGIKEVQRLIEENEKMREAFCIAILESRLSYNRREYFYTKEEYKEQKDLILENLNKIVVTLEKEREQTLKAVECSAKRIGDLKRSLKNFKWYNIKKLKQKINEL